MIKLFTFVSVLFAVDVQRFVVLYFIKLVICNLLQLHCYID